MRKTLSFVAGLVLLAGATTIAHAEPTQQDRAVVAAKQAVAAKAQTTTVAGMADGSVKINGVPLSADTVTAHTPWTGKRFNSQYVCGQNNIGSTWNIEQAMAAFESGTNSYVLNYRPPASWGGQPCSNLYSASQTIIYGTYNSTDSTCYSVTASSVNGRYNDNVVIGLNLHSSASSCRATAQRRNNTVSQATGNALGLANFYHSTAYSSSIMNDYWDNLYNFAGGADRTSICQLLGICPS